MWQLINQMKQQKNVIENQTPNTKWKEIRRLHKNNNNKAWKTCISKWKWIKWAKDSMPFEWRWETLFVACAFLNSVALRALSFEDLLAGFHVTRRCFVERRHSKSQTLILFSFLCKQGNKSRDYINVYVYINCINEEIKGKREKVLELWRYKWMNDQLMRNVA